MKTIHYSNTHNRIGTNEREDWEYSVTRGEDGRMVKFNDRDGEVITQYDGRGGRTEVSFNTQGDWTRTQVYDAEGNVIERTNSECG